MYKIMLADDEGIVIDSLKFLIEKKFGDQCIIDYAKTGRSVIELAERFRPDIAIMDIQMPGINGIDAMKEIQETNRNIVFIVMSAYDKFDYAQEVIKMGGVLEYITKPMEQTSFITTLKKAMNKVDNDRKKRSNELIIKEKLETVIPVIESGFVYNILLKEHFEEDIKNYMTLLEIKEQYGYMVAIVSGDDQKGNHMTNAVGSGIRMQKHYMEVRQCIKDYVPNAIIGSAMGNKVAFMVPYHEAKMGYNERIILIGKARELARKLRNRMDISLRIGLGSVASIYDLSKSYSEALDALINTNESVAHADDLPIGCEYEADYPVELEKRLFSAIEKADIDDAVSFAGRFFDWMVENYSDSIMDIRLKTIEFVLWAEHMAYSNGGMTYQFKARQDYLPDLLGMEDYQIMRKWFINKIISSCQDILTKKSERSINIIEQAKNHIQNNYNSDLSLDDISRIVDISPYYFSKIFKEETGVNFIDYLTNIRIEKAKELLTTTDYSMKEICTRIGYSDPNYFSRAFKKNVGITPTEYKEGKYE